jgi:hypothetical protein
VKHNHQQRVLLLDKVPRNRAQMLALLLLLQQQQHLEGKRPVQQHQALHLQLQLHHP